MSIIVHGYHIMIYLFDIFGFGFGFGLLTSIGLSRNSFVHAGDRSDFLRLDHLG